MAKLVIVESPAKAKTIGKYLGKDYEVTASMGHIRDLPKSQLGIDVEHDYAPQYINIKDKSKLIKELKAKAKQADGTITSFAMVLFSYIINSQPDGGSKTQRNAKGSLIRGAGERQRD